MDDMPDIEDPWVLIQCKDTCGRSVLWANPRDNLQRDADSFAGVLHRMDDVEGFHLKTVEVTITGNDGNDTVIYLGRPAIYSILEQMWRALKKPQA